MLCTASGNIARGVFTSVPDLTRKLRRYINAYSANARPIQWKYSDLARRIRTNELSATDDQCTLRETKLPLDSPISSYADNNSNASFARCRESFITLVILPAKLGGNMCQ